jgi:hypothetical protein
MAKPSQLKHPPVVPREYAGQWIAWDRQQTRIVAHGRTFAEVQQAAVAAGERDALFAKAPKADQSGIGF